MTIIYDELDLTVEGPPTTNHGCRITNRHDFMRSYISLVWMPFIESPAEVVQVVW